MSEQHIELNIAELQELFNKVANHSAAPNFAAKALIAGVVGYSFLSPIAAEASTEVARTPDSVTVVLDSNETVLSEVKKQGYSAAEAMALLPVVAANSNLVNANLVKAGIDKVVIPLPSAEVSSHEATTYRIQRDDNLTKIAREKGTTIAAILTANPSITDPDKIYTGHAITIPAPIMPAAEAPATTSSPAATAEAPTTPQAESNPTTAPTTAQSPKLVTLAPSKKTAEALPSTTLLVQPPKIEAAPPTTTAAPQTEVAPRSTAPVPKPETAPPTAVATPKAETAATVPTPAQAATPAPKLEAAPVLPSSKLNLANIKPMYGAEASRIQDVVRYLVDKHGFSPKGAAYMAGSGLRESWLKTDVSGDQGKAKGLFGMTNGRAEGLPADFYGQIDHAVTDMTTDQIAVKKLVLQTLRDINASDEEVQLAIRWFERYDQNDINPKDGIPDGQGQRFEFGDEIYKAIMTPIVAPPAPVEVAKPPVIVVPPTAQAPSTTVSPTTTKAPATTAPPTTVAPTTTAPPTSLAPKLEIQNAAAEHDETQEVIAAFKHPYIDKSTVTVEENGTVTVEVQGEKVSIWIAQQLAEMVEASEKDGVNLIVFDGFRTKEEQIALRKINGCPNIWTSQPKECKVETAKPGESNHEHDTGAVDFRYKKDGVVLMIVGHDNPAYIWLKEHAKDYGFKNLPSEAWHWSPKGN